MSVSTKQQWIHSRSHKKAKILTAQRYYNWSISSIRDVHDNGTRSPPLLPHGVGQVLLVSGWPVCSDGSRQCVGSRKWLDMWEAGNRLTVHRNQFPPTR